MLAWVLPVLGTGCGNSFVLSTPSPSYGVPTAGVGASWAAVPVVFGSVNPTTPSLLRLNDGSWALAYGSDRLGSRHLYFTKSTDGNTWSPPQGVGSAGLSDEDPALFQDAAGQVHMVFASNRDAMDFKLYESTLQGKAWSTPQALDLPGAMQASPAIARTPQGWALAYQSGDGMVVAQSADAVNWSTAGEVVPLLDAPAIAQIGGQLVIVGERANQLIEVDRDTSGKWSTPEGLPLAGQARQPALATDASGSALLAFATRPADGASWQLATASRTGSAWSTATAVASADYDIVSPSVQLGTDGRAFIAWGIYQADDTRGIFFAAGSDPSSSRPVPSIPATGSVGGRSPEKSTTSQG